MQPAEIFKLDRGCVCIVVGGQLYKYPWSSGLLVARFRNQVVLCTVCVYVLRTGSVSFPGVRLVVKGSVFGASWPKISVATVR